MNTSRETIINEIKRTTRENGGEPLGRQKFSQVTEISKSDWYGKLWARWGDALREAGFEPNELQEAYPEKELLEKLCAYTEELGKFPTDAELRLKTSSDKDFPSHSTFGSLGSKKEVVEKTLKFVSENGLSEQIIKACQEKLLLLQDSNGSDAGDEESEDGELREGIVYLIKSGRFYKIGKLSTRREEFGK